MAADEMADNQQTPEMEGDGGGAASAELARLRAELDDAKVKHLRALADFQNYQRRAYQNEQVAREQGVSSLAQRVITVLDHFDLALTLNPENASASQVMDGVRVIREELLKALSQSGVRIIEPKPNDEFTPGAHEAIMHQAIEGVESGRVSTLFQPGFALGERVIRAAKVGVAP